MTGFPLLESDTLEADLGVPSADVDPLGLLDVAGLGWLVEQVDVLREPLDWLAGHGERFEDAAATWRQVATTLDGMARRRSGGWLTGEIAAMSRLCSAVASHVAEVRAITAAVHGVFRDVVALFVREVLDHATVALAAASGTLGPPSGGILVEVGSYLFATLVFGALILNVWEELAWGGLAQTRLMARHGLLVGSLLTAP